MYIFAYFLSCIVNLGVISDYTVVTGCMASDWHPRTKILTEAQLVEHQRINLEVAGSSPAPVNFSLFNPKLL